MALIDKKKSAGLSGFRRYFINTSWLYSVHGVRLFVGFFVGLWLARFLGPEKYGIYNYVFSINYFFLAVANMGVTDTLVKAIVEKPGDVPDLMRAGFQIRCFSGLLAFGLQIIFLILFPQDQDVVSYLLIASPILLLQSFEVVDSFYSATVNVGESAKWRIAQIVISSLIKVYLIWNKFPLVYFVIMGLIDTIFYSIAIYFSYKRRYLGFVHFKINKNVARNLLIPSVPLMIVALANIVFARVDQVIVGSIIDQQSLGKYSSAVRIVDMINIFYLYLVQSLFPAIVAAKQSNQALYEKRLKWLSRLLLVIGVVLTSFFALFSKPIVKVLYGDEYSEAANVLTILSFNILFFGMSHLGQRWYITENLQRVMVIKVVLLAILGTILNAFVVPRFGIIGAAYTSLVLHFVFYFLFEVFSRHTRDLFRINSHV